MVSLVAALALVLLAVGVGLGAGVLIARAGHRHDPLDETGFVADGLSATLGTVGGLLAFTLGFLVVFTLDNFTAAQDVASREASAYGAAFESAAVIPAAESEAVRRNVACLTQAVRDEGWLLDRTSATQADDNIEEWWLKTRESLVSLPERTPFEEFATETVFTSIAEARTLGENRLLMQEPMIPAIIWVLIYLAFGAVVTLTYVALRFNTFILLTSVGLMTLVVGAVIAALITFAAPFSRSDGTSVEADDLTATIERLRDTYPGPAWDPCERLAP